MACHSLYAFQDWAEIICNFWNYTDKDALAIETWLKKGANVADYPSYMKLYLDHGARLYLSISYRLSGYTAAVLLANPLLWLKWFDQ
ncbi:hypothetical protein TGAMA5MH_05069 [Trichoderma gamsii]|uniref:Uncharacterized protein n=1 Tax=Trichoderma gamsii TaxID=398673 RepID=A0A2K0TC75_9HYPO|nr:hypothetical protein TGAMA5MH_05069 [Trichoderma gamsii]